MNTLNDQLAKIADDLKTDEEKIQVEQELASIERGIQLIKNTAWSQGSTLIDTDDGRVRAVLDWELCTLGDPLADVGYLGVYWTDPGDERDRTNDPTGLDGFPTYSEMVERYARRTGRDVSEIDYYVAFGSFRLAVISEGVYARYVHGSMGDQEIDPEMLAGFKAGTEQLAESALAAMRRST